MTYMSSEASKSNVFWMDYTSSFWHTAYGMMGFNKILKKKLSLSL